MDVNEKIKVSFVLYECLQQTLCLKNGAKVGNFFGADNKYVGKIFPKTDTFMYSFTSIEWSHIAPLQGCVWGRNVKSRSFLLFYAHLFVTLSTKNNRK